MLAKLGNKLDAMAIGDAALTSFEEPEELSAVPALLPPLSRTDSRRIQPGDLVNAANWNARQKGAASNQKVFQI